MDNKKNRVRFAPSPTGPLHMGGVRTALYNYLFAKKNSGIFILRIEDTDRNRYVAGAEKYIIESLKWCGICYDEGPDVGGSYGPYRQSERKNIYRKYADELIKNNYAYYAFDTSQELEPLREISQKEKGKTFQYDATTRNSLKNSLALPKDEVNKLIQSGCPYTIRIKISANEKIRFRDLIRDEVVVNTSELDDKVLLKSDGMPTYHLANIVDDYLMEISHVIRGEEWLPSAPLHVLLYKYFGWENKMPEFAHLPLLLKPNGQGKLSKRDGDKLGFPVFPLKWEDEETGEITLGYREAGYLPEAFINMLAMLGWSPGTTQEIFSAGELIHYFALEQITKAGAKFTPEKAKWFNHQYLIKKNDTELAVLVMHILQEKNINCNFNYVEKVCALIKDRLNFVTDFWQHSYYFFVAPDIYDEKDIKKIWKEDTPLMIKNFEEKINSVNDFVAENIKKIFEDFLLNNKLEKGYLMGVLRMAITGKNMGPDLFQIAQLLGKEEILKRIAKIQHSILG